MSYTVSGSYVSDLASRVAAVLKPTINIVAVLYFVLFFIWMVIFGYSEIHESAIEFENLARSGIHTEATVTHSRSLLVAASPYNAPELEDVFTFAFSDVHGYPRTVQCVRRGINTFDRSNYLDFAA